MNLLESYKGRLAVAESYYAKSHNGEKLSNQKKIVVAKLLENANRFLNEAFENSVGTQRSDMGLFRKFALNLTTVAVPNLIAFDLVYVYPMSSYNGYVTYLEYCAGSNKGKTNVGDTFNSPFGLAPVDEKYTSSQVEETKTTTSASEVVTLGWGPVIPGTLVISDGTNVYCDDGNGNLFAKADIVAKVTDYDNGAVRVTVTTKNSAAYSNVVKYGLAVDKQVKPGYGNTGINPIYTADASAQVTLPLTGTTYTISYSYNNVVIPQNDLPILTARMNGISLIAHARRIAVYYSQMAAFQAKQDYGFDLGDSLAQQAVGRLSYEIDTECVQMLVDNAPSDSDLVWSKTLPMGVSKQEHYAGFVEILEAAASKIYDRTQRFSPNFMIIASSIRQILAFVPGFEATSSTEHNGPYFFGTLNGIKIYVSPALKDGKFVLGVNNGTAEATAAIYAPYMPIVPTQLLNYADGAFSQGWSTLYDMKILNANLLIAGRVTA